MSWKATAYVKDLKASRVTQTEKILLYTLADYHNPHKNEAWPSLPRLADESLMSERTARRTLQDLEDKGILKRIVPSGGHSTSVYAFLELSEGGQNDPPVKNTGRTNPDPRGDKIDVQGGQNDTCNKERTIEPITFTLSSPAEGEKSPHKANGKPTDPRFAECKRAIFAFYRSLHGEDPYWTGKDAGKLGILLKENPGLRPIDLAYWLQNYGRSEGVNEALKPYEFMPRLHRYESAPLDKYGKPMKDPF